MADLAENDPELAMALRVSMEEHRAREAEREKEAGGTGGGAFPDATDGAATAPVDMMADEPVEPELAATMQMSLQMSLRATGGDGSSVPFLSPTAHLFCMEVHRPYALRAATARPVCRLLKCSSPLRVVRF